MNERSQEDWLGHDEKYALIGLSVNLEDGVPRGAMMPNLSFLTDANFQVPPLWQEWLGSVRCEEISGCNLFLLSTMKSKKAAVLDAENQILQSRVWSFYVGLLMTCLFSPAHKPNLLTGAREGGEIGIFEHSELDFPPPGMIVPYPSISGASLKAAAQLGEHLVAFNATDVPGGRWRLNRIRHLFVETKAQRELLDRIHQFTRCIDGLIVTQPGYGSKQFKSRTELFVGSRHHVLMGEIYDVRSKVEHLREHLYLEEFDREARLELVKKEAVIEFVARKALARNIGDPRLWPYFANTAALDQFWASAEDERRRIWGPAIDPLDALKDFNPSYIQDNELGGP